jgi:AmpD protein
MARGGLEIDISGYAHPAEHCPSPHADERPPGSGVDLLVIHAISLPPGEYGGPWIRQFFQGKLAPDEHPYFASIASLRVSSHFLIERDGTLVQFVATEKRAWHAGVSSFLGRERCNDFSVGVELEGCDDDGFTAAQYDVLVALSLALQRRYPAMLPERCVGHQDIAPGRKTDPGPGFDWRRFLAQWQMAASQATC